jgi:hypothetical protein
MYGLLIGIDKPVIAGMLWDNFPTTGDLLSQ